MGQTPSHVQAADVHASTTQDNDKTEEQNEQPTGQWRLRRIKWPKFKLNKSPQKIDSPLVETAQKQLLNPGVYAINDPFVHNLGKEVEEAKPKIRPFNLASLPAEAQFDCAMAWFSRYSPKWKDEDVVVLLQRRYSNQITCTDIEVEQVKALRILLEATGVHRAARGVQAAQDRWKAEAMGREDAMIWQMMAKAVLDKKPCGADKEENVRQQRTKEWADDQGWSNDRRPITNGMSLYDLDDILKKP